MTIPAAVASRMREMNDELNRLESIFQKERLASFPLVVQLSTGTRCNLRCVFCTDRGPATAGQYGDLTLAEFIPLAAGLEWVSTAQLWGWGEPFINPHYGAILDYVTGNFPGIEINISTNGTLFDDHWQRRLLDYGRFSVNVSINAATRETYGRIAGCDLFEQMATHLRGFRQLRQEYRGRIKGRFSVSFVVVRENMHEIADFIDLAAELGAEHVQYMDLMAVGSGFDSLSVREHGDLVRDSLDMAVGRAAAHGISVGTFLPYAAHDYLAMERYGSGGSTDGADRVVALKPCYEPWWTMMVCSDGTATLCCRSRVVTGNLRSDGLDGVWNSQTYQEYRKSVNSPTPPDVCKTCPAKLGLSS